MVRKVSPVGRWIIGASSLLCGAIASAAPGDRDITFGTGGGTSITIPGVAYAYTQHMFPQADGKLVAVGYAQTTVSTPPDFLIYRLNANGTIDTSFNSTGPTPTPGYQRVDVSDAAPAYDIAIGGTEQPDGKLLIVGEATPMGGGSRRMAILRLLSDGRVDTSFGTLGSGKAIVAGAAYGYGVDAFVQSDNSIIVAGSSSQIPVSATSADFALAKFTNIGVLDPTFGVNGVATIDLGTQYDFPLRALRQADGRFVLVGHASFTAPTTLQIARFNSDGTPDNNFGVNANGKVIETCIGACQWNGVTQQADGKLILAGFNSPVGVGNPLLQQHESIVARLNVNGTPDATFGAGSGRITGLFSQYAPTTIPSGDEAVETVVDPSTNQILILGSMASRIYNTPGASPSTVTAYVGQMVARVSAAGVLDTTYGNSGLAFVNSGIGSLPAGTNVTVPETLLRLADGRLIVSSGSGAYVNGSASSLSFSVARLLNAGGDPGVFSATYPAPMFESIGNAVVRVFRTGGASGAVSVSYATNAGTALAGSDFTTTTGTLTWADGDYSMRFVSIPILSDNAIETSDESFSFVLSSPTGGADVLGSGSIPLWITRDDNPSTTTSITLSQAAVSVAENAGSVTLTVTRTGTSPLSVNYYTVPLTATVGSDFTRTGGILVWDTGDTASKSIMVPIGNDAVGESAETFNVVLVTPASATIVGGQTATVTITDDDPPVVGVTAASALVSEALSSVTINVTRVGATTQSVSVNYATANGTATAGADFTTTAGTLTWLPGDADTKTITIPLLGDSGVEGTETFTLTLSGVTAGTTLGAATTTITIADDDVAAPGGGGGGSMSEACLLLLAAFALEMQRRKFMVRRFE